MLRRLTDRLRLEFARIYGRQPFVRRGQRWLFAQLATALPAAGRARVLRTRLQLGNQRVRLWVDGHSTVGLHALMFGEYEPASMSRLLRFADAVKSDAPVFLDIGANVGFYSVAFALAQRNARVIACEPGPGAAALCARNIAAVERQLLQQKSAIELVRAAVADHAGEAQLSLSHDIAQSSLLEVENFAATSIKVALITVDELLAERSLARVDVCKIDVEGAELEILRGMTETLRRAVISLIQIEVNRPLWARSGRTAAQLVEMMSQFGYELLANQHTLLEGDDWAIEDFIFFAPQFRDLARSDR